MSNVKPRDEESLLLLLQYRVVLYGNPDVTLMTEPLCTLRVLPAKIRKAVYQVPDQTSTSWVFLRDVDSPFSFSTQKEDPKTTKTRSSQTNKNERNESGLTSVDNGVVSGLGTGILNLSLPHLTTSRRTSSPAPSFPASSLAPFDCVGRVDDPELLLELLEDQKRENGFEENIVS